MIRLSASSAHMQGTASSGNATCKAAYMQLKLDASPRRHIAIILGQTIQMEH